MVLIMISWREVTRRTKGGVLYEEKVYRGQDRRIVRAQVRKLKQRQTGRYVWP